MGVGGGPIQLHLSALPVGGQTLHLRCVVVWLPSVVGDVVSKPIFFGSFSRQMATRKMKRNTRKQF